MMSRKVGSGGFFYPSIYSQSKDYVTKNFKEGRIDYGEFSSWSFADKFMAYLLATKFLEFADRTYPTPREKAEIPVWFLICCQIVMRMTLNNSYTSLHHLMLNAGPVLLRVGFNIGSKRLGFNNKNEKERLTSVDQDTVRKFFKDTKPQEIRDWYNIEVQRWFKEQNYFDTKGIYVLDQTHCVVPDNKNYKDAAMMPVDEHGQIQGDVVNKVTGEVQKAKYRPCYSLSYLLHLPVSKESFHVAGYEWGPGNEDEIPQARKLLENFHKGHKDAIKLLIVDRGYISGELITEIKRKYNIDVLIPLRKNMHEYTDAVALSKMEDVKWESESFKANEKYRACIIDDSSLWKECKEKLYTVVVERSVYEEKTEEWTTSTWVLCTTKNIKKAMSAVKLYNIRTQIEERNDQFKNAWCIADFPSPNASLIEAQVCFILLTYSLIQSYLVREDLQRFANKTIETLRREDALGINNMIIYKDDRFAVYDTVYALNIVNDLETKEARQRLREVLNRKK